MSNCPICGSSNIETFDPDIRAEAILIQSRCEDCNAMWTQVYYENGYTIDEYGDKYETGMGAGGNE
jgi:transposase-like protein